MGEALHVGRNIVLVHQVVSHGAGLADVLADLDQFAHHLRVTNRSVPGNEQRKKFRWRDVRKSKRTAVTPAQSG